MKKFILFSSFILLYFSAFTQSFLILNALKQNVSNSNATVTGDASSSYIKGQFYIVNDTSVIMNFKVKKIENNVLANTLNSFCFNGQCYPPFVFVCDSFMALPSGDTTTASSFYGDYTPSGIVGSSVITYVVYDANNPNDSTYVTVTYQANLASISKPDFSRVDFSNPYPNPASVQAKINYNIPLSYNKATLILRNLIGTTVKEYELDNTQGRIVLDLADLDEGIYFYSLIIDGNVVLTRKLIKN